MHFQLIILINDSEIEILIQKFAHFDGFEGSFLTMIGLKESFSGLFKCYLGVV